MAGQIKVSNFAEVKALSSKLEAESNTANNKIQECSTTINDLSGNMQGEGVDSALKKLESENQTLGNKLIQTMQTTINFINQQTSGYTQINQEVGGQLSKLNAGVSKIDTKKGKVEQV